MSAAASPIRISSNNANNKRELAEPSATTEAKRARHPTRNLVLSLLHPNESSDLALSIVQCDSEHEVKAKTRALFRKYTPSDFLVFEDASVFENWKEHSVEEFAENFMTAQSELLDGLVSPSVSEIVDGKLKPLMSCSVAAFIREPPVVSVTSSPDVRVLSFYLAIGEDVKEHETYLFESDRTLREAVLWLMRTTHRKQSAPLIAGWEDMTLEQFCEAVNKAHGQKKWNCELVIAVGKIDDAGRIVQIPC